MGRSATVAPAEEEVLRPLKILGLSPTQRCPQANWESDIHSCFGASCHWETRLPFLHDIACATSKGLPQPSQVCSRSNCFLPYWIQRAPWNLRGHSSVPWRRGNTMSHAPDVHAVLMQFSISLCPFVGMVRKAVSSCSCSFCIATLEVFT